MALPQILTRVFFRRGKREVFFCVELYETFAVAHAFEQINNALEILQTKEITYIAGFDGALDKIDEALYVFEKDLSIRFNKVLFVLPASAVHPESREVIPPYRTTISEIVHNLELQAMGYIEMNDLLKESMSPAETTLLIEVGAMKTHIMLLRKSQKIKQTTVVTHATNIATHVRELVGVEVPIHIVALCEKVHTNAVLAALSDYHVIFHTSTEIVSALHELLREQFAQKDARTQEQTVLPEVGAVASDAAPSLHTEMSQSVEESLLIDTQPVVVPVDSNPATGHVPEAHSSPRFVEGFEIFSSTHSRHESGTTAELSHNASSWEDEKDAHILVEREDVDNSLRESVISDPTEEQMPVSDVSASRFRLHPIVGFVGVVFGLLFMSLVIFELTLHKVKLTVVVPTEKFEWKQTLENIPVQRTIAEESVKASINTTGETDVGDPATGTISLASFADEETTFEAGTKVFYEDYAYTLDKGVTIPAATVNIDSGTKQASKQEVAVTATFIGTEGNVGKGKKLQVEDYPSSVYYALTESDFRGGSKQTVSVVTDADMKRLKAMVVSQTKKASESARNSTDPKVIVLDEVSEMNTSGLVYSNEVGDQASSVRVEGVVRANLYSIERGDIVMLVQEAITAEKKRPYVFAEDAISYQFDDVKLSKDGTKTTLSMTISVDMYPDISSDTIKNVARFKSKDTAIQEIKKMFGASEVLMSVSIYLPPFQYFVPVLSENIDVFIEPVSAK